MNKLKLEELIKSYSGEQLADFLFQAGFEKNTKNLDSILPTDDIFSSSVQLGEIKTNDNQKVLVVETKVSSDLSERSSRKKQFDVGKKLLQNNQAYAAGLLVFYDDRGNFRLSLVHPKFEGTKRSYNSFKRYTFYVNPTHSNKTFINQFSGASFASLDSIKEVFSVAKVTFDFFKEYKRLFEQIVESIKRDGHFPDFAEKNGVTINDVAKKLLGQIVFLYFLQRKGWLGATKGQHVSKGDQNFLRTLFNKAKEAEAANPDTKMNFFNDYLEYLFYDALNKPITDSATSCYRQRFECQIPFLNGGLFEPIPEYKWQQRFLQIPDEIFSNNKETGVLDIFDSYNFTIDENSADDQEVSVDPEMLGKVFENLLEENLRKGTGSFYTPREIVQYMVTESLKQYLRDKTDIREEKIAAVLEEYHNECEVSEDEAEKIDNALKEVRVVDPACGSGAFLVGLLQEIAHIRHYCQRCYQTEPQTYYQIKKEIIRDSIYGVDLDGGAVDIARLRFWLSMVVDHDIDIDDIEPLPNLDYKLMQGNSLLEDMYVGDIKIKLDFESGKKIDRRTKQAKMFDDGEQDVETQTLGFSEDTGDRIADKLVRHHNEFFAEKDPIKKALLKKKIDSLESELIVAGHDDALNNLNSQLKNVSNESNQQELYGRIEQVKESKANWLKFKIRPYFPWRLHFSEVFERGGFNIVVGNPPYVSAVKSDDNKTLREVYRKLFIELQGAYDIYAAFLLKGLDIKAESGVFCWIIPNKFLVSEYSKNVLRKLKENGLKEMVSVSDFGVFGATAVYPIILFGDSVSNSFTEYELHNLDLLKVRSEFIKREKINSTGTLIKDLGLKVGSGTTGFQAKQVQTLLVEGNAGRVNTHIPFIVSGCVDKFVHRTTNVQFLKKRYQEPFVSFDKSIIAESKWNFWCSPKIVIAGMTKEIEATYVTSPLALGVGVYAIYSFDNYVPEYLVGVLNSKYLSYYLKTNFKDKHLAGGYLAINKSTIELLPICDATFQQQEEISGLVKQITQIKAGDSGDETMELEGILNEKVMDLYNLSDAEKEIVRNS